MPDWLGSVLATPGLIWLILRVFVAGMVRGFSGFGTAMIYLPGAAQWLSPFAAITTLVTMEMIGPLPNIPRALREGHWRDVLRLGAGMALALPLGVWVLSKVAPEVFRYGLSFSALGLLVLLMAGVRYRGNLHRSMIYLTGGLGGFMAGVVGLPGPPIIMLYMAARHPTNVIRASIILYLFLADAAMLLVYALFGNLVFWAIGLGLVLAVPYLLGNMLGARIFRPEAERAYRLVAYAIIAFSAVSGLPFLG